MRRRFVILHAVATGLAAACAPVSAPAQTVDHVEVIGAVRQRLRLSAADLASFPVDQQVSASSTRRVGSDERSSTVSGVRLISVLERAGLDERDRFDWRKSVVLATATDGYRAVFSWPELVNTDIGRQVLLVYERDGVPLDAREGPVALSASGDLRTGPRHVRNLARLEVRILRD